MAEIQELNKSYLLNLIKHLRSEKKKFYRAYPLYCQGKIPYDSFHEHYAIPLINIKEKIETFRYCFDELEVKYPKLPTIEEEVCRAVEYWYQEEEIEEELIYKGEKITVEFDRYIPLFDEYWQKEFWLAA